MNDAPEWLVKHIQDARQLLGLGGEEWHFTVKTSEKPGGTDDLDGQINVDSVYMNANIEIINTLEDGDRSQEVAYHEVIHAAMEDINRIAYMAIRAMPKGRRKTVRKFYNEAVERFVTRTSRTLCANLKKDGEL